MSQYGMAYCHIRVYLGVKSGHNIASVSLISKPHGLGGSIPPPARLQTENSQKWE